MTTITTHYITQDLASPYADIERLPRLTAEEEAQLLHDLHLAQKAHSAKVRLIEGYLPRVLTLAKQYDRRYRVITFDDLVQEGSLALMQAIDKCAVMPITKSLSCYIGTVVRSAFRELSPPMRPSTCLTRRGTISTTPDAPRTTPGCGSQRRWRNLYRDACCSRTALADW